MSLAHSMGQKIAASEKKEKESAPIVGPAAAYTVGSAISTGTAIGLGHLALGAKQKGPKIDPKQVATRMGINPKDIKFTAAENIGMPGNYGYLNTENAPKVTYGIVTKKKETIGLKDVKRPQEAFVAHELGHARTTRNKYLRHLQRFPARRVMPRVGAIAGGAGLLYELFNREKGEDISYLPAGIAAASNLPMLTDEALANLHATKYLTKQHGIRKGLRRALPLLPAMGSYLALSAAPLVGTAIVNKLIHLLKNKEPNSE